MQPNTWDHNGDAIYWSDTLQDWVRTQGVLAQVRNTSGLYGPFGNKPPMWNCFTQPWWDRPQPLRGYLTSETTKRICGLLNAEFEAKKMRDRLVPFMEASPTGITEDPGFYAQPPSWSIAVVGRPDTDVRRSNAGTVAVCLCNYGFEGEAGAVTLLTRDLLLT